ncbi:MAG: BREX system ATP-binding domain-containing protein [Jatrophihabitantaceae bacterium]
MTAVRAGGQRLSARRAVEALRSGVPSRDAVAALGSGQGEIEDRVCGLLDGTGTVRDSARGILLGGGFGAGKSHVLEHLAHLALERGFVVSRVVISKETPLHDPVKVLRAAVDAAVSPDGAVGAVTEAAASLDPGSPAFTELLRWAVGSGAVDERFALTLGLLPRVAASDEAFADAIVRFWSGDALGVAELRRQARAAGEGRRSLSAVPVRELALQRFRFPSRLFVAAGWQGWLLLFDEVELIGRYTLLQRARSYADLANWLLPDLEDPAGPIATVAAMTDDFDAAVLTEKKDRTTIADRLRAKQSPQWDAVAARAETGMRMIERDMLLLRPPDAAELDDAYRRLKRLHSEAFDWQAPDVAGLERLGATRMRQYVRAWINEWDLVRLDPDFVPESQASELASDYAEQPD